MTKRRKIILVSLLLSLGLFFVQTRADSARYPALFGLAGLTYLFSAWALKEGLNGIEWVTVLCLPVFFTTGFGLFSFLLPANLWSQVLTLVLYALGIYILLLTENIFSVATIRNIQLLRAAQATGFLLTLITTFFLFDAVLSFRLDPWLNGGIIFLVSLVVFFQGLWKATIEEKVSWRLLSLTLLLAFLMGQVALAISFWPLTVSTGSLFLITVLYVLLGLVQSELQERLFAKTIREYLWVGVIVFLTIFLTTHWGG
jgi:hypothetical protein